MVVLVAVLANGVAILLPGIPWWMKKESEDHGTG